MKCQDPVVECRAPYAHENGSARLVKCGTVAAVFLGATLGSNLALGQIKSCDATPKPSFCNAVRGDRAEGWLPQPRSEVRAQRNGRHQPATGRAGGHGHPEEGRERHRRRRRSGRGPEPRRADKHWRGCGPVRDHLHREREQAVLPERERKGADGPTLQRVELARLLLEPDELGVRVRHARRHPVGDGAGRRLGMGRSADEFGNVDASRRPCSRRLTTQKPAFPIQERIGRTSIRRTRSGRFHRRRRIAAPRTDPDSVADVEAIQGWNGNPRGPHSARAFQNPDLAKTFRLLQQTDVMASTKVRSPTPSSPSRTRSAGR